MVERYTDQQLLDAGARPEVLKYSRRESGNKNVGWEGLPGSKDYAPGGTDLSGYPLDATGFPMWPGKMGPKGLSTAAGPWQTTRTTWHSVAPSLGVKDFSIESQAKVANELYRRGGGSDWVESEPGRGGTPAQEAGTRPGEQAPGGGTYIGRVGLDSTGLSPVGSALLANLLKDRYGAAEEPTGNSLLDGLLKSSLFGTTEQAPQPSPTDVAVKPLQQFTPPPPPQTVPELQPGQPIPTPRIQPIQQPTMPSIPQIPAPQPAPVPATPMPGQPSMPSAPPPVAPPPVAAPPSQPVAPPPPTDTGNNLLNQLLKQVSPISTAQAAEREPPPQPAPQPQAQQQAPPANTGNSLLDHILKFAPLLPVVGPAIGLGERMAHPLENIKSGLEMFQPPESQKGLDITTPQGFRQAALDPAGLERSMDVALSVGPGTIRLPSRADLQAASQGIQKIFSPTTVDPASRMAERMFRQFRGQAERETAQAEGQVSGRGPLANPPAANMVEAAREPWRPLVAKYVPEFERYLAQVRAAVRAGTPIPTARPALLRFLDFVEGRSSGVAYTGPPELRDLADTMQKIFADRAAKIQAEPSTAWAGFIQDYFPHMWKEKQPGTFGGVGARGQGSGRSLRQRTGPPTISDGIAAGLTPKSADPIGMMMDYVANIDRYLAHNKIFRITRQGGGIGFYAPGHEPQGWMPLQGRLAERAVATGGVPGALGLKAYAPEGFARVYNNAVSTGFFEGQMGGPIYSTILRVKNGITATVLALSGYHPMAMAQEATASGLANAIQALKRGDIIETLKQLGLAPMLGVKAIGETFGKGRKLERQYSGIHDYGPDWERIADLWAKGGGRGLGRGAEWQASAANNFITSFRRSMTGIELRAGMRHVGEGGNILSQTGRAIGFTADQMGRIMDTLVAPLFDTMVPRIKKAAFFDEMSEWLRQNPTAGPDAQIARARDVLDRLDDRFGEMMMDNIFWGKRAKQSLNLLSTSLGWELGSVRSLGGAPFDFVRAQFASPRVRYTIGLGVAIAIQNAMYQYLKTGKTPGQDTGGLFSTGGALDLTVPRTGGTTPEGAYERELLPGFEKDILGYWKDPLGEFAGKLSPFGKMGVEMFTGRDQFTGKPIDDYPKYTPQWFKAWGDHLVGSMSPIPFRQEIYKGSNIPTWERFMGGRPAPEYLQNPERMDQIELAVRIKDLKTQIRSTAIHDARTQVDPKETEQKIRDITDQIQMLTGYYQKRIQDDIAARARHFPATPMPTQPAMQYR